MKIIGLAFALLTMASLFPTMPVDGQPSDICVPEIKQQLIAGSPWKLIWGNPLPANRGRLGSVNPEGTVEVVFTMEQGELKAATQNVVGASTRVGPISNLRIENCRVRGRTASGTEVDLALKEGRLSGTGTAATGSRITYESAPGGR